MGTYASKLYSCFNLFISLFNFFADGKSGFFKAVSSFLLGKKLMPYSTPRRSPRLARNQQKTPSSSRTSRLGRSTPRRSTPRRISSRKFSPSCRNHNRSATPSRLRKNSVSFVSPASACSDLTSDDCVTPCRRSLRLLARDAPDEDQISLLVHPLQELLITGRDVSPAIKSKLRPCPSSASASPICRAVLKNENLKKQAEWHDMVAEDSMTPEMKARDLFNANYKSSSSLPTKDEAPKRIGVDNKENKATRDESEELGTPGRRQTRTM